MKKLLVVFVVLTVCSCLLNLALADTFSIPVAAGDFSTRNGITFGMDAEKIIAIETPNLIDDKKVDWTNKDSVLRFSKVSVFGDQATLLYGFDQKGSMVSCGYYINPYYDNVEFADLEAALIKKYGNPIIINRKPSEFNTVPWIYSSSWDPNTLIEPQYTRFLESQDGTVFLKDYDSWFIKYDNYYVVIELARTASRKHLFGTMLGYSMVDKSRMEAWLEIEEQNMKETKDSFNDDL